MSLIKKFLQLWQRSITFSVGIVFVCSLLIYSSIYFFNQGDPFLDDHYFHFKYAQELLSLGKNEVENTQWIYNDIESADNARYNVSFFHIALTPFTFIEDPIMGLKTASVFFGAMTLTVLYWILRRMRVRYAFLYILILIGSTYFLVRSSVVRPHVFGIALIFLELFFAAEKKYRKFFFIALLHILWHKATFFMPLLIGLIVEVARYLQGKTIFYKNIVAALVAIVVGMMWYPGYPQNIIELVSALIGIHAESTQHIIAQGEELYPKDFFQKIVLENEFFLFLFLLGMIGTISFYILQKRSTQMALKNDGGVASVYLYASFLFLILIVSGSLLVSGRLFDYYFPAVIFSSALVLNRIYHQKLMTIDKRIKKALLLVVIIFIIFFSVGSILSARLIIAQSNVRQYEIASDWIKEHSDRGEEIFLHNWNDFVPLYFYNSDNPYTMGLEPSLLLRHRPDLYWKWYNVRYYNYYCEESQDCHERARVFWATLKKANLSTQNKMKLKNTNNIVESVRNDFGAHFIVSKSSNFSDAIAEESQELTAIFKVRSQLPGSAMTVYQIRE